MRLTVSEFNKIRPLHWKVQQIGNDVYYTVSNKTETQLFWMDFMRHVFAPKFKKQNGINTIYNFDQRQAVLITSDLELKLNDPVMEQVAYNAENLTLPFKFSFPIPQMVVMIVSIIIIIITVIANTMFENSFRFSQTYVI